MSRISIEYQKAEHPTVKISQLDAGTPFVFPADIAHRVWMVMAPGGAVRAEAGYKAVVRMDDGFTCYERLTASVWTVDAHMKVAIN